MNVRIENVSTTNGGVNTKKNLEDALIMKWNKIYIVLNTDCEYNEVEFVSDSLEMAINYAMNRLGKVHHISMSIEEHKLNERDDGRKVWGGYWSYFKYLNEPSIRTLYINDTEIVKEYGT